MIKSKNFHGGKSIPQTKKGLAAAHAFDELDYDEDFEDYNFEDDNVSSVLVEMLFQSLLNFRRRFS